MARWCVYLLYREGAAEVARRWQQALKMTPQSQVTNGFAKEVQTPRISYELF
jgi:hypothetical protein